MPRKISFLDKTFWITESKDNTKHIAGLQLLAMPDDAREDYLDNLVAEFRRFDYAVAPFDCRVKSCWRYPTKMEPVKQLDMSYHIQQHHIGDVTDKRQLHALVARLHDVPLDRQHPLWQYHLIRDDKGKYFASYLKIHHIYADGATLVKWLQAGYQDTPEAENFVPMWAKPSLARRHNKVSPIRRLGALCWDSIHTVKDMLAISFRLLLKLLWLNKHYMPLPLSDRRTHLTGQVKSGRAVTTVELDFKRVQALAKRTRASVNEVFLCAFDIAVHRLLKDYGESFDCALYTNMPINLRKPGDQTCGNKIAIVPVELAYGEKDPYLRLRQIIANHRIVKTAAQKARPASFSFYTIFIQSFALLCEMMHLSDWVRPIANMLISNVPGPKKPRYMRDSKLVACYPISAMTPGGGVNITVMSYAGVANVGMVCCNRKVKSLDPLADYFLQAFSLLEHCVDNPDMSIDDIGEQVVEEVNAIVVEPVVEEEQGQQFV